MRASLHETEGAVLNPSDALEIHEGCFAPIYLVSHPRRTPLHLLVFSLRLIATLQLNRINN
jgi:hypothetical protein